LKFSPLTISFFAFSAAAIVGVNYHLVSKDKAEENTSPPIYETVDIEVSRPDNQSAHFRAQSLEKIMAYQPKSFAGSYLASQFAQRRQDWQEAARHIDTIKDIVPNDPTLMRHSMVLEMGAGNTEEAMDIARALLEVPADESVDKVLASLFVFLEDFKNSKYDDARLQLSSMEKGELARFIVPLMRGWLHAADGKYDVSDLNGNAVHVNHAMLIAEFLDKTEDVKAYLTLLETTPDLTRVDREQIADLYASLGETDRAMKMYKELARDYPQEKRLARKAEGSTDEPSLFTPVEDPKKGVARAMNDMAHILYQDGSDDSARIFAHMALHMWPDMNEPAMLLADIAARNGHIEDAVKFYQSVPQGHLQYLEAKRKAADVLAENDQVDRAVSLLQQTYDTYADIESLIQIGDIQRRNEHYTEALETYNKVVDHLGGEIPADYWYLHYVRGMVHERLGNWALGEVDLLKALSYQPHHPYILNYLGYAWADRGLNLEKATEMIETALKLQPYDGFITDSLGWVYYKTQNYEKAVEYLEQAVELMPADPTINDHLGDAYWQVGRKLEARFQWKRALGLAEGDDNQTLMADIQKKIDSGIAKSLPIQAADSGHASEASDDTVQTQ
jgi:tetratricopeptide (TPR) repeat protein